MMKVAMWLQILAGNQYVVGLSLFKNCHFTSHELSVQYVYCHFKFYYTLFKMCQLTDFLCCF